MKMIPYSAPLRKSLFRTLSAFFPFFSVSGSFSPAGAFLSFPAGRKNGRDRSFGLCRKHSLLSSAAQHTHHSPVLSRNKNMLSCVQQAVCRNGTDNAVFLDADHIDMAAAADIELRKAFPLP